MAAVLLPLVDDLRPRAGDGNDGGVVCGMDGPRWVQPGGMAAGAFLVAESRPPAGLVRVDGDPHLLILTRATDSDGRSTCRYRAVVELVGVVQLVKRQCRSFGSEQPDVGGGGPVGDAVPAAGV